MTGPATKRRLRALAERVQGLIDDFAHGNVTVAANESGIAYDTLYHIARGHIMREPNYSTLSKLAAWSGKSVEWIVNGDRP